MTEEVREAILNIDVPQDTSICDQKLDAYTKAYHKLFRRSSFLYDYFIHIEEGWVKKALEEYINDIHKIDLELSKTTRFRHIRGIMVKDEKND